MSEKQEREPQLDEYGLPGWDHPVLVEKRAERSRERHEAFRKELGKTLERHREAKGLSKSEVAKIMRDLHNWPSYKPTTVSRNEEGLRDVSLDELMYLARVLRVPVERLIGVDGNNIQYAVDLDNKAEFISDVFTRIKDDLVEYFQYIESAYLAEFELIELDDPDESLKKSHSEFINKMSLSTLDKMFADAVGSFMYNHHSQYGSPFSWILENLARSLERLDESGLSGDLRKAASVAKGEQEPSDENGNYIFKFTLGQLGWEYMEWLRDESEVGKYDRERP